MKDGGSIGVTGTPAFIINGKSVVGAQPFEAFQKAIDAALAKAK
jgi:protein-disulfide isomerase